MATKDEKGRILDEYAKTTGMHRKSAIRLLNRSVTGQVPKRRGRKAEIWVGGRRGAEISVGGVRPSMPLSGCALSSRR